MKRRDSLVQHRQSRNWSQKDVTQRLESLFNIRITESYYGMIEQGVRTPSLEIALAIAKLFETTPDGIFFGQSDNKMLGS